MKICFFFFKVRLCPEITGLLSLDLQQIKKIIVEMVFNTFIPVSYIDRNSITQEWVKTRFQKMRLCPENTLLPRLESLTNQKDCDGNSFQHFHFISIYRSKIHNPKVGKTHFLLMVFGTFILFYT